MKAHARVDGIECAGFKTGICSAKPLTGPYSLLTLSNNTSVVNTLTHAYDKFMQLYRVRAHVHHYSQFMDMETFTEALSTVTDTISSYNESAYRPYHFSQMCKL